MCTVELGGPSLPLSTGGEKGQYRGIRCGPATSAARLRCVASLLFVGILVAPRRAESHPVSQGALDIVIYADHVHVSATVSTEEVLVAAAHREGGRSTPLEAARGHADYLLAHLRVTADGRTLPGRIVALPERWSGRPAYEFEYRLDDAAPAHIRLEQDVLREFEFAPGNSWEASYLVRIGRNGQPAEEDLLLTSREPLDFWCDWGAQAARFGVLRVAAAFLRHGIFHILTGYDHLLFVGALMLAVTGFWELVKVISAFTLAHSITLTLSVLDVFRLPESVVEPMISASIVVVAGENFLWPERGRGRGRLLAAFLFGLFHGLGFASGLLAAMSSLSASRVVVALGSFSAGVEIGHQLVVIPLFVGLLLLRRSGAEAGGRDWGVRRYGSALISLAGMIYLAAALRGGS